MINQPIVLTVRRLFGQYKPNGKCQHCKLYMENHGDLRSIEANDSPQSMHIYPDFGVLNSINETKKTESECL